MGTQQTVDDLVRLSDADIQSLLREIEVDDIAIGLKGASAELNGKVLNNMSEHFQKVITEEMERLGSMAPEGIEAAQQRILQKTAQLGLLKKLW